MPVGTDKTAAAETNNEGGKTRSGSANIDKSNQVKEKQSKSQRAWMRMDEETLQCSELQGHDENETVIKSNARRVRCTLEKINKAAALSFSSVRA